MTQVDVDLSKPTQDGDGAPAAGKLECRPTMRRALDDDGALLNALVS